jgi:hypothetical protein
MAKAHEYERKIRHLVREWLRKLQGVALGVYTVLFKELKRII